MNKVLFSSKCDAWTTPIELFKQLNDKWHFDIDACASDENALCKIFYSKACSILDQSFTNKKIFMNPPYGRNMYKFIQWCSSQQLNNDIVLLVPSRTDTKWFHDFIYKRPNVEIQFIKGRLKFGNGLGYAPFPSMIVIFNNLSK